MVMNEMIAIGRITKPHGIRGWLKVIPLTDFPERFQDLEEVYLDLPEGPKISTVEAVNMQQGYLLLKLEEIDDRNGAEELRDRLLKVTEEELVELPEGHYYLHQLLGLKVFTLQGEDLGRLEEIIRTGSNDVYRLLDERGRELLIPATREVVKAIDLEEREIRVCLPAGLRD